MDMKTIVYRGGVLRFRIPETWIEEYSDYDGGMFYEDGPTTGTLRVKIISLAKPSDSRQASLAELLKLLLQQTGKFEEDVQYVGENALIRYEEAGVEAGTKLTIFYWVFANPVDSLHARVVNFSYTVLATQRSTPLIQHELDMLDSEIVKTEFASEVGVTAAE